MFTLFSAVRRSMLGSHRVASCLRGSVRSVSRRVVSFRVRFTSFWFVLRGFAPCRVALPFVALRRVGFRFCFSF